MRRLDWLRTMMWLMGGVGLGFEFPASAMEQFERGLPWTPRRRDSIEGGHYVSAVGMARSGHIVTVTWGKLQLMSPEFYMRYADEVIVYLDSSRLRNRVSPEGFHFDKLRSDLGSLGRVYSLKPDDDTEIA
jgi:hypothetical protein